MILIQYWSAKTSVFGPNRVCLSSNIFSVLRIKRGGFGIHVVAKGGIYTLLGLNRVFPVTFLEFECLSAWI